MVLFLFIPFELLTCLHFESLLCMGMADRWLYGFFLISRYFEPVNVIFMYLSSLQCSFYKRPEIGRCV